MADWFARAKRAIWKSGAPIALTNGGDRGNPSRRMFSLETLEPRLMFAAAGLVTAPQSYSGTLSDKIVYTSPGHGYTGVTGSWLTQRPDYWTSGSADGEICEDFGNEDQFALYVDYLLRSGATVVPMRPVGRQVNEIVLDNDSASVTYSGSWSDNAGSRWYDEDYGSVADPVHYRVANISPELATATYTPIISAAGFYPVYTWVASDTDRTSQLYLINHTNGQTQVRVDHRMVGNGWVYLGTYHFNAGSSASEGSVVISNQSTAGGSVVVADSIRFGNGMGDLKWNGSGIGSGSISGKPREDEAAQLWCWRGLGQGIDPAATFPESQSKYFAAPAIMAALMNTNTNPFGTSVYIGIHSNGLTGAPDAAGRGALGLYHPASDGLATPHQQSLAGFVGQNVNTDMQALNGQFEYNWSNPSSNILSGSYFEISNAYFNNEMDATIAEVGFHDNLQDNALLRDPKVRDQIARSLYDATLQYFVNYGGVTNTALPSAPTNVRAASGANGQVTIAWAAGPSDGGYGGQFGNPADGFRIYASTDGYGYDGGTYVAGGGTTSATLTGYDPTRPYYFKVVAVNAGGESKPSEVITALPSGGVKQVLIVNGFDRFDRTQNFQYTYTQGSPDGFTERLWARYNNSRDYAVQVESAIHAAKPGVHVDSTSNEAIISGTVNLGDYDTVIWLTGNESTKALSPPGSSSRLPLDSTEQTKVTNFIDAGGNFFVSGSEIAWDLDNNDNGRTFYQSTLGAGYVGDSANTFTTTAAAGGIFAGMSSIVFSSGSPSTGASAYSTRDDQVYKVSSADVISAQSGSVAALTYSGGTGGTAAIQKQGTGGKGSVVMFGFPFETITSASQRQTAMGKILDFFAVSVPLNADFNGSGIVDAADYVNWRMHLGITSGAAQSQGDANGDGAVNSTDYSIWRQQFGTAPPAGSGSSLAAGTNLQILSTTSSASNASSVSSVSSTDETASHKSKLEARDAGFSALVVSGVRRANSIRRSAPQRTSAAIFQPDWTDLLNDLAARNAQQVADESAPVSHSRSTKRPGPKDATSQIDCPVAIALVTIEGGNI